MPSEVLLDVVRPVGAALSAIVFGVVVVAAAPVFFVTLLETLRDQLRAPARRAHAFDELPASRSPYRRVR